MASSPKEERTTGVVYDDRLAAHFSSWNKEYTEQPARYTRCVDRCQELGLLKRCKHIPVREATEAEMLIGHSQKHVDLLRLTESMTEEELKAISQKYDYIYFHQKSFENAKLVLGGVVDLIGEIVSGKIQNGMAIIRPPGHHALTEEFNGYCYLGNVAIATQIMLDKHHLKRVLVVDWDVHHGQGTQFKFYDDPRVLFVSIHRYELGSAWPCLRESDYDYIGTGPGRGYTINVPLNEIDCGNDEYLSIFFNLFLPVFYEFDPEFVIVSAGYDSAIGCPEGEMCVTPACFAHFVNLLTPLAAGKLALVLEGGYNLKSLSESVALSVRALLGDPTPNIAPITAPKLSVLESVLNCVKVLHPYWRCLRFQDMADPSSMTVESYPFSRVLHHPPVQDINFYTSETRPTTFPLIQDCAEDSALHNLEEKNQRIDELIQLTVLSFPHTRLSIAWEQGQPGGGDLVSKSCSHLRSAGIWAKCQILEASSDCSASDCVKQAVDSILLSKSRCSLCLVESSVSQTNGVPNGSSPGAPSPASLASEYAILTHNALRVLTVQLTPSCCDVFVTSKPRPSVLHMTLASRADQSTGDSHAHVHPKIESYSVDVPFISGTVSDSDIITASLQILLPLSYEFNPEFVVFSWKSCPETSKGNFAPSPALFGHVTQLLCGLARGRLLVLVEHGQSQSRDCAVSVASEALVQCATVLLGQSCHSLGSIQPSDSTVAAIKEAQDRLKAQWKVLQFRQQIPQVTKGQVGPM